MNREILFRGKRADSGEWVEGSLIAFSDGDMFICCTDTDPDVLNKYAVNPTTVGQYTGLTDKNGVKIFEGDILRVQEPNDPCGEIPPPVYGSVRFGVYGTGSAKNIGFFVGWQDNEFGDYCQAYRKDLGYWHKCQVCEVCGNIHDNSELFKEAFNEQTHHP